jgi:serine protease Do
VGVNTAIISQGQGIGFAVPINMVKDLLPNLRVNGRLARGWLGVTIQEETRAQAAVVKEVYRNSPAARAGILPGDRVLAVNGRSIETYLQLLRRVAILAPGSEAKLTLRRGGQMQDVTVRLTERPAPETLEQIDSAESAPPLGLILRELNDTLATRLGIPAYSGLFVSGVLPGSAGDQAGLKAGDLITEVNRKKIQDVRAFRAALQKSGTEKATLLQVLRGEDSRYVAVGPG